MRFAEVMFVSAKNKLRTNNLLTAARKAYENANRRVPTAVLNQVVTEAISIAPPPPGKRSKRLRIYYATQVSVCPPLFLLFVNDTTLMTPNYLQYLERKLREAFDFAGAPIKIYDASKRETELIMSPLEIVTVCFYLLVAYFIGSIPTGYWLAKRLKGVDIRQMGSGSTGATNVYRCIGKVAGIFVFIVDFLKGYLPVLLVCSCYYSPDIYHLLPVFIAAAILIGHSCSIFLNFKGGKSAATGLGTLFALNLPVGLSTFLTWMVVLYISKMVSVASIIATATCILYMVFFGGPPSYIAYCVLGFIYVTYRHKENIKRIMAGTEAKIGKGADKQ